MSDALYIGATGMQAQQLNVDTIANNLVNVNTPGFKKGRVSFTDLMVMEAARQNGVDPTQDGGPMASIARTGSGVGIASMGKLFDQGSVNQTGSAWDIAIQGDGFLEVTMADGSSAFCRGGTLKVNHDGLLTTQSGQALKPTITIPTNATSMTITPDGNVLVTVPNQNQPVNAGQLQMVHFANPGALLPQGDNLYRVSEDSGEPMAGNAGQDGIGTLQQGYLEGSNVKMVDEMVNLMVAQRSYEASVKVVQTADELLAMVNNLRK
ncbi:MAG TPA: flagellar basal-body rod protein FlgG [Geothrix sp.]|nr:flagellar basal-body rod protein FlgG [Geothrix sp.]